MKDLILIGGGSFGREVAASLPRCLGYNTEWKFKGFIDNIPDRFGIESRTIGLVHEYLPAPNDVFICTLPEQKYRKKYVSLIADKGGDFISLVHASAEVYPDVKIGKGVYIGPLTCITCNVIIGDFTLLNSHVGIGHDAIIGPWCHVNAFTLISGFVEIGSGVTIHPHASILPGKKVGDDATVGVGSIVLKNVPAASTVFGYPAKKI